MSSLETQRRWNGLCAGQAGVVRAAVQRGSKDLTAWAPAREGRGWWRGQSMVVMEEWYRVQGPSSRTIFTWRRLGRWSLLGRGSV